ncbi:hypothetical protein [Aeromicrobium duanguangcaii]|nr:hypothetical protein [Aeromicrobium duanguangcaii]MCD9153115.1 hypothetical protein [Aeromicrobium duanguangcaii]
MTWWNSVTCWLAAPWLAVARGWWLLGGFVVLLALLGTYLWSRRRKLRRLRDQAAVRAVRAAAEAEREHFRSLPRSSVDFGFAVDESPVDDGRTVALTPEQEAFVRQQLAIGNERVDARSCEGGTVLRAEGGREALVLDVPVRRRAARAGSVVDRRPPVRGSGDVRIDLRWPDEVLIDEYGDVKGYFAPALEDTFLARSGVSEDPTPRTLEELISGEDPVLTPFRRVEIARSVCGWLLAQHRVGLINAQVDPRYLLVDESVTRVTPVHYRGLRLFGSGGWSQAGGGSHADDRAGFARLAWRLLWPRGTDPRAWLDADSAIEGLDDVRSDRVRFLLRRGLGPAAAAPTMEEWAAAL